MDSRGKVDAVPIYEYFESYFLADDVRTASVGLFPGQTRKVFIYIESAHSLRRSVEIAMLAKELKLNMEV